MFCRISPKCKFLLWAIELDIFKVILYFNNELYLLLPNPLAVAKGHSNSLRKRFCEISRAFGWWWGHVSHPYLRSQSRSSNWDIKVTIKIVEIVAMAPSGIEHVFSLVYMLLYPLPFFSLSMFPFPSLSLLLPHFFFLPCYCPYVLPSASTSVGPPPHPYPPPISLLFGCFSFFCGGN